MATHYLNTFAEIGTYNKRRRTYILAHMWMLQGKMLRNNDNILIEINVLFCVIQWFFKNQPLEKNLSAASPTEHWEYL